MAVVTEFHRSFLIRENILSHADESRRDLRFVLLYTPF